MFPALFVAVELEPFKFVNVIPFAIHTCFVVLISVRLSSLVNEIEAGRVTEPAGVVALTVTVKSLVCAWLVSPQVQAIVAVTVKTVAASPCVIVTVPSSLITKVQFAVSSVEVLVAV